MSKIFKDLKNEFNHLGSKAQGKRLRKTARKAGKVVGRLALSEVEMLKNELLHHGIQKGMRQKGNSKAKYDSGIGGRGAYMMGRGSYSVEKGSASSGDTVYSNNIHPTQSMLSEGDDTDSFTISKREYIGSIRSNGESTFSNQSWNINPGLSAIFPFASQFGENFTEYEIIQCIFEYKPMVSAMSVSTVGSMGNVIMCANYNSGDAKFASFMEMTDYTGAVNGKICDNVLYGLECDPAKNANNSNLFVRATAVPAGQDVKTYDFAKFQIGLYGVPVEYLAGTELGLLYATYKIKLSKTRLYSTLGRNQKMDSFYSTTAPSNSAPLGTAPRQHINNGIGCIVETTGTTSRVIFPDDLSGAVMITMDVRATSCEVAANSIKSAASISGANYFVQSGPSDSDYFFSHIGTSDDSVTETVSRTIMLYPALTPMSNYVDLTIASSTGLTFTAVRLIVLNPKLIDVVEMSVPTVLYVEPATASAERGIESLTHMVKSLEMKNAKHKGDVNEMRSLQNALLMLATSLKTDDEDASWTKTDQAGSLGR